MQVQIGSTPLIVFLLVEEANSKYDKGIRKLRKLEGNLRKL